MKPVIKNIQEVWHFRNVIGKRVNLKTKGLKGKEESKS